MLNIHIAASITALKFAVENNVDIVCIQDGNANTGGYLGKSNLSYYSNNTNAWTIIIISKYNDF